MRLALPVVLLVAAFLRLDGIGFGLDRHDVDRAVLNNNLDERGMVASVLDGFLRGDMHPGEFLHRGSGAYYVYGTVDAAVVGTLALFDPGGWDGVLHRLADNPWLLFAIHRGLSVLAAVLTVLCLMRLLRRELGELAAVVGGCMLATAYLHVRETHFGSVDGLFGLLVVLVLDVALRLVARPTLRTYALCGALAGGATAVKYFGGVLGLHLVAAHLAARAQARSRARTPPAHGRLLLCLALTGLGFALLSFYVVFAFRDLVDVLHWSAGYAGNRPSLPAVASIAFHHARETLPVGLGEPVYLLGLLGLVLGWRRGGPARLFTIFAVLMVPSLVVLHAPSARYGLPMVLVLVPPAAVACAWLMQRLPRPLAVLLLLLVLLPSTARSVAFDRVVDRLDTRVELLDALSATGVPPQEILAVGNHGLPSLHHIERRPYTDLNRTLFRAGVVSPAAAAERARAMASRRPRFILRDLSGLVPDPGGWIGSDLLPLLQRDYHEVLRLDARQDPRVELPDTAVGMPTHMVPYARPWAVSRPGPPLVLYERND